MRKSVLVVCSVLLFGSALLAQNKIDTKWHCSKEAALQKMDVGDMADHSYMLAQGTCSATAADKGFEEKSGAFTEFRDLKKTGMTNHGRFLVTMGNGDKVNYSYAGSAPADTKKPASNKWTLDSGTGKLKGGKGSGGCSGMMNADGSSDWHCTGTYTSGK
jgi:hypothetical protein